MGDPMLDNIENLIRSAIAEINAFTKKAIEDNEIRKLVASMDAVKRNITDYSVIDDRKDQISNEFLLTDAILKTSDAISQCRTLGVDAVICNADAVSLNILSKIAFHKLTNATNSKQCVLEIIGEARGYLTTLIPPFIAGLDPARRISVPNPPCLFQGGRMVRLATDSSG